MNREQIEGNWHQLKGKIKEKWGKLTDDDIAIINGKYEQLLGKIQQKYGYSKEQAEKEIINWKSENRKEGNQPSGPKPFSSDSGQQGKPGAIPRAHRSGRKHPVVCCRPKDRGVLSERRYGNRNQQAAVFIGRVWARPGSSAGD